MTMPAATFAAVAPRPDGLAAAFSAARRRRNSKAAVSAFGGAVAIASVLSFLAPPGQNLVQEPSQPAGGNLAPGILDSQREQLSPRQAEPRVNAPPVAAGARPMSPVRMTRTAPAADRGPRPSTYPTCVKGRWVACVVVHAPAPGGPSMRASVCQSAATVTVDYALPVRAPIPVSGSKTFEVGAGRCGS
jgi:hypothetical protein